ncbi:MAG: hypothetical protein [Thorarchaeia virus VerdaV2]|uniref:Uncharacterized protein n=1 Tax=Thorarchaeia virus VerdaV2 TaxID=3070171 RepID=A0AA35CRL6_9CAUD|nr:MAG: hypothetical protein QIT42_gp31 [Thorarchaeia virus VerdaV2]BDI54925.1 MAG: hypothetical protein [Thorarchaeia virus VerdaV2]
MSTDNKRSEELQVKFVMRGKTMSMFTELKDFYNLGYNVELIRFVIKKVYDEVIIPIKQNASSNVISE